INPILYVVYIIVFNDVPFAFEYMNPVSFSGKMAIIAGNAITVYGYIYAVFYVNPKMDIPDDVIFQNHMFTIIDINPAVVIKPPAVFNGQTFNFHVPGLNGNDIALAAPVNNGSFTAGEKKRFVNING